MRSAGSTPADEIDPAVVEVMAELGIDITEEYPKPLTDEFVRASDVVITMGCGDACPVFPGKRYEDWELDDPAGKGSRPCARSATRSIGVSGRCWPSSCPPSKPPEWVGRPRDGERSSVRRGTSLG